MEEHVVVFLDILGFSEAVRNRDGSEKEQLVELVRDFALMKRDSGPDAISALNPAITTFSDSVVVSVPMASLESVGIGEPQYIALGLVRAYVGNFAAEAARLGLLIRGGATVGSLFHSGGVVVGEAMIEAHYLESQVSIYPRISVSQKLSSRIDASGQQILLLRDQDGITHLDYFDGMIRRTSDPVGADGTTRVLTRFPQIQDAIAKNMHHFENRNLKIFQKWAWFKKHIEEARIRVGDAFYNDPQ